MKRWKKSPKPSRSLISQRIWTKHSNSRRLKSCNQAEIVGIISADLQDPPELFLEMFDHWKSGFKLVIAERTGRDESLAHSFVSGFYWRMVSRFAVEGFPKVV